MCCTVLKAGVTLFSSTAFDILKIGSVLFLAFLQQPSL